MAGLLACLAGLGPGTAVPDLEWEVVADRVAGRAWGTGPVTLRVAVGPDGHAGLRLALGRIELPEPLAAIVVIPPLELRCRSAWFDGREGGCQDARIGVEGGPFGGRGDIAFGPRGWSVRVEDAALAMLGGRIALDVEHRPGAATDVEVRFDDVAVGELVRSRRDDWEVESGRLYGRVRATLGPEGGAVNPVAVEWSLRARDVEFASARGTHAAEGLAVTFDGHLRHTAVGVQVEASVGADAGIVASHATVLDIAGSPVTLRGEATYEARTGRGTWRAELDHAGVARIAAEGTSEHRDEAAAQWVRVELARSDLRALYAAYLEGVAIGTPFESVEARGTAAAVVEWRRGEGASAEIALEGMGIEDREGRFGLAGLSGTIVWSERDRARARGRTRLSWSGGSMLELPFGASAVVATLTGRELAVEEPLEIPLLDGGLLVRRLGAAGIGTEALEWRLEAALRPVSMEAVSAALDWPSFGGTVSGELPGVRYRARTLELDGALAMRLLEGEAQVTNLSLHEPFGPLPRLVADVAFRGVSLDALTRAFSFGRISGRLDGEIRGLELVDWRPSTFDARFFTPPDDDSRHRISQGAVDTLAQLGGGSSQLLSTTFLRFFEEFSYDDLGLSCRLRNGICEMGGIADDDDGYFIVRGRGVPRISVKGYNRRVHWPTLIERLHGAIRSGPPTVR